MRKWFVGKLVDIVPLGIGGHYPGEDIKSIKFKREYQRVWNWDVFYDVRISISMTITMVGMSVSASGVSHYPFRFGFAYKLSLMWFPCPSSVLCIFVLSAGDGDELNWCCMEATWSRVFALKFHE